MHDKCMEVLHIFCLYHVHSSLYRQTRAKDMLKQQFWITLCGGLYQSNLAIVNEYLEVAKVINIYLRTS